MTARLFMLPALIAVLFLLANGNSQAAEESQFRTWTDPSGEHQWKPASSIPKMERSR